MNVEDTFEDDDGIYYYYARVLLDTLGNPIAAFGVSADPTLPRRLPVEVEEMLLRYLKTQDLDDARSM